MIKSFRTCAAGCMHAYIPELQTLLCILAMYNELS